MAVEKINPPFFSMGNLVNMAKNIGKGFTGPGLLFETTEAGRDTDIIQSEDYYRKEGLNRLYTLAKINPKAFVSQINYYRKNNINLFNYAVNDFKKNSPELYSKYWGSSLEVPNFSKNKVPTIVPKNKTNIEIGAGNIGKNPTGKLSATSPRVLNLPLDVLTPNSNNYNTQQNLSNTLSATLPGNPNIKINNTNIDNIPPLPIPNLSVKVDDTSTVSTNNSMADIMKIIEKHQVESTNRINKNNEEQFAREQEAIKKQELRDSIDYQNRVLSRIPSLSSIFNNTSNYSVPQYELRYAKNMPLSQMSI